MNGAPRRVAITGIGLICPLGNSTAEAWSGVVAGQSGVGLVSAFDAKALPVQIAGEVRNFDPEVLLGKKLARHIDRFTQMALVASDEAVKESGLLAAGYDPGRMGAVVATGLGGILTIEEEHRKLMERGPDRVSPFFVPKCMPNAASGQIAIRHNLQGPNFATASACAASAHAVGIGGMLIGAGMADAMVVGGAEAIVSPLGFAGFIQIKALSRRNAEPTKASRPFDADRDGFVIGEGAGILVLEELERAQRRGARIYAELTGMGTTDDAYHITAPSEDGEGAARAMRLAIEGSRWEPETVNYVNAHGTSTKYNDAMEAVAIAKTLGAGVSRAWVSSTKSQTGHLIGAAGGVEAAITCLAIEKGVAPPSINCETQDSDCSAIRIAKEAVEAPILRALSNSFGFGGHNVSLAFAKV